MKPTLVVMAAGMGSRYGGLKQIDPVGPAGEIVIDYSVYDAVRAGFGKVVFVIRRDIESAFREAIEPHFAGRVPLEYVFQELDALPSGFTVPEGRKKPWGTAHAILCCRDAVREPFGVINADDFYGRDAFARLGARLGRRGVADRAFVLIGYRLINTLSEHGAVSRGVCRVDARGHLLGVAERTHISKRDGEIVAEDAAGHDRLPPDTVVSMNMWGFTPALFDELDAAFLRFLTEQGSNPKAECYIPTVVDGLLREGRIEVEVAPTDAVWLGMTYPEDRAAVRAGIQRLVTGGDYTTPLWQRGGREPEDRNSKPEIRNPKPDT